MVNIIKEEIEIEESLESRLRVICDFCNTTPTIINGSIRKIDKTNNDYKTIQDLSVSLKDISNELSESKETIKILQEPNDALELRNSKLKEENNKLKNLKEIFEIFKNKLERLYHFFVDKMWGNKEKRDKYYGVAYELYGKSILDDKQMKGILGTKERSAEIDNESKSYEDDMEL